MENNIDNPNKLFNSYISIPSSEEECITAEIESLLETINHELNEDPKYKMMKEKIIPERKNNYINKIKNELNKYQHINWYSKNKEIDYLQTGILKHLQEKIELANKEYEELKEKLESPLIYKSDLEKEIHFNEYIPMISFVKFPIKIDNNKLNYTKQIQLYDSQFEFNLIKTENCFNLSLSNKDESAPKDIKVKCKVKMKRGKIKIEKKINSQINEIQFDNFASANEIEFKTYMFTITLGMLSYESYIAFKKINLFSIKEEEKTNILKYETEKEKDKERENVRCAQHNNKNQDKTKTHCSSSVCKPNNKKKKINY